MEDFLEKNRNFSKKPKKAIISAYLLL